MTILPSTEYDHMMFDGKGRHGVNSIPELQLMVPIHGKK